jgi:hypothetical protein
MCSFWYVECLSRMGDLPKARFLFEKMLGYANHLGLYGEELGPRAQQLGNFPTGLHAPGADQRRIRSGPAALGRRPCRLRTTQDFSTYRDRSPAGAVSAGCRARRRTSGSCGRSLCGLRGTRCAGPRSQFARGQAGSSSRIENYLGFPTGISGQELAGRANAQAQNLAPPGTWLFHLQRRGPIPVTTGCR